jgi:hypothetical protein
MAAAQGKRSQGNSTPVETSAAAAGDYAAFERALNEVQTAYGRV